MLLTTTNLLALGALAGLVASAPTPQPFGTAGNFSVKQVRNANYVPSGQRALAKAYRKYNKPLPADLAAALTRFNGTTTQRRDTGSAVTTPEEYDVEYLTPVTVGTPGVTLNLDFDTGSADLWVFSSELSRTYRSGHSYYTPSSSSTSEKLSGYTWEIEYADGSGASGDVYTDVVTVGGLSVTGQAVEAAERISSEFAEDTDNDGLLGLAFSTINTVEPRSQKTFFENALSELDEPVFTADLKYEEPGTYNFGYIDTSAYTGSITYTSVDSSEGYWGFTSSGYGIGSSSFKSTSWTGIADTGTTLALFPDSIVEAYYDAVSGASYSSYYGGYVFPCSTTPEDFVFGVGSARITIPGQYINYAPADYSGSTCYGGIQSNSGLGLSIFGDVALKAAFVVFDDTPRLGWASKDL